MMSVTLPWSEFKNKGLPIRYATEQGNYYCYSTTLTTEYVSVFETTSTAATDFEANYKPTATSFTSTESFLIFSATSSQTVGNTTTESSLIGNGHGALPITANSLVKGSTIHVIARGTLSTTTPPGNCTITVKLGSTVLHTATVEAPWGFTNRAWKFDMCCTCRSTGTSGSVFSQASLSEGLSLELNNTDVTQLDMTQDQVLDVTWTWETADPANSITCTNFTFFWS